MPLKCQRLVDILYYDKIEILLLLLIAFVDIIGILLYSERISNLHFCVIGESETLII